MGKKVKIPKGYEGLIVKKAEEDNALEKIKQRQQIQDDDENEELEGNQVQEKALQAMGRFDAITVWGHESIISEDDAFVRGVEEWITFAEAVSLRCYIGQAITQCPTHRCVSRGNLASPDNGSQPPLPPHPPNTVS